MFFSEQGRRGEVAFADAVFQDTKEATNPRKIAIRTGVEDCPDGTTCFNATMWTFVDADGSRSRVQLRYN